jgi:hypothetical protein
MIALETVVTSKSIRRRQGVIKLLLGSRGDSSVPEVIDRQCGDGSRAYRLTRERYDSKVNVIKEYMGQGGNAQGSIQTTDEAAMLVRAKL